MCLLHQTATFGENDLNFNKLCDYEEFVGILQNLGVPLNHTQAKQAFGECDVKGRGEVDFNEFLLWWGENENKMRAAHHDQSLFDIARETQARVVNVEMALEDLQRSMKEALQLVPCSINTVVCVYLCVSLCRCLSLSLCLCGSRCLSVWLSLSFILRTY